MIHLGLIGYPLGHSLSPKIQAAALKACHLDGDYALFPIAPNNTDGLKNLLACVRAGELTGVNVTIPHKQNVIPLLDALTEMAQTIGAVNTISIRNGQLIGDNTDAPGFLSDLNHFMDNRQSLVENRKSTMVLGAGGSARAVVYALVSTGWDVTIAARRIEQAQELVGSYSALIHCGTFEDLPNFDLSRLGLIVNTTPLGMSPNVDASPWPEHLPFPSHAAVYDLIYNPRETRLIREARAAGSQATTGLGMLIEQASQAFEIWTGHKPPRDLLWQAVDR
jgi:shikimate dehydrogenase